MRPLVVFIFISVISLIANATSIPLKGWVFEREIMDSKAYSLNTSAQSFELSVTEQNLEAQQIAGIKKSSEADLKKWWKAKAELLSLLGTTDQRLISTQAFHDAKSSTWVARASYRDSANELIDFIEVTQFTGSKQVSIVLTSSKSIPLKDRDIKGALLQIKGQLP